MWSYIIPIITLIVGLIGGFALGIFTFRRQMMKMQSNPDMLQQMAKSMGYNLNKQQMSKMQQMMKNKKFPR